MQHHPLVYIIVAAVRYIMTYDKNVWDIEGPTGDLRDIFICCPTAVKFEASM